MSDNTVELRIQVNTDTGQMSVLNQKLDETASRAKGVQSSFSGLTSESKALFASFLPFTTVAGIVAFLKSAADQALETEESMRRLSAVVQASGGNWETSRKSIEEWASAVEGTTRFSGSEATASLERLALSTNNISEAISATTLAMNINVKSTLSLADATELVNGLITGQERAVITAEKALSAYTGGATTAQGILQNLSKNLKDAAVDEQSHTKEIKEGTNAFKEFSEELGTTVVPALAAGATGLTYLLKGIKTVVEGIRELALVARDGFNGIGESLVAILSGNGSQLASIMKGALDKIESDMAQGGQRMAAIWQDTEDKKKAAVQAGADAQLKINADARQKEIDAENKAGQQAADDETARFQSWAEQRQKRVTATKEQNDKLEQMEAELDSKMAALNGSTLKDKLAALDSEVKAKQDAVNKLDKVDQGRQTYLDKLSAYEKAEAKKLADDELFIKQQLAYEVISTAIQSLQAVNSLSESGSKAEVIRAKALLALQEAAAIGWAWVASMKAAADAGVPWLGPALAAAQTVGIVAQFDQGLKQIDQAQTKASSDLATIPSSPTLPTDPSSAPGSPIVSGTSGVSTVASGGTSSVGQSQPATTIIDVGGISVQVNVAQLGFDNITFAISQIVEAVRRGTVEGVQLAVVLKNTADKNANLAV